MRDISLNLLFQFSISDVRFCYIRKEISYAKERTYTLRNSVVGNNTKTSAKRQAKIKK